MRMIVQAAIVLGSMWSTGCSVDTAETGPMLVPHCGDDLGDQTCQAGQPGRPYCDLCRPASQNQGCVGQPPAVPACRPGATGPTTLTTTPPTGDTTATSSGTGDTDPTNPTGNVDTSSSGSSSSEGPGAECKGDEGELDDDCVEIDADRPYCVTGACSSCSTAGGDDFCDELDSATPACDADGGVCGGCGDVGGFECAQTTPICDSSGACVACASHDDCPDTACHLDPSDPLSGQCFAEDEVIWVDNNEICPGSGTEASPNCSLSAALGTVGDGESAVVRVAGSASPYDEDLLLTESSYIALLGTGAPTIIGSDADAPSLQLDGGTVYASGLRLGGNPDTHGIDCSDSVLWLQGSDVSGNAGYGVYNSSACRLVITGSSIHHNAGGGVRALGGRFSLWNSAVGVNGDGVSGPGLLLQYVEADVLYSTVAGNDGVQFDSIQCLDATGEVRNSIVVGAEGSSVSLDCFPLEYEFNAIDTTGFTGAEGTLVSSSYSPSWFNNEPSGDFRLDSPALTPFGDVAVWSEGDPLLDADGTPRPLGGETGFAGVDEPG